MELDFHRALEQLRKPQTPKNYLKKANELKKYVLNKANPFYAFRLSVELDQHGLEISDLEDYLIQLSTFQPHYLIVMAIQVKSANTNKLQEAIIRTQHFPSIAEFAVFCPKADKSRIEDLILASENPKAIYTLLRYSKSFDVDKFKHCLIQSKKPRYLFAVAKKTLDPQELQELEDLILRSRSFYYMRLFYSTIPGASLEKLEARVLASRNPEEIKKTYALTKSKRLAKFVLLIS